MQGPLVRVVDAALHAAQAPVHVVVTGLGRADEVLEAVSHAGANARLEADRLHVVAKASQLVDAAGRTGGAGLAEPLRERLDAALDAWQRRGATTGPLHTPAGDLPLHERPVVMGVVNVTPDSFSDGGAFLDPDDAVAHGEALAAAGADVLDVGGASTRPGAESVAPIDELARVEDVVRRLAAAGHVVSVDTTSSLVAERCVGHGAAIVNDVSAGRLDDDLVPTVASLGVPYVLMHARQVPVAAGEPEPYDDLMAEVFDFLGSRLARLAERGLSTDRVVVDPGIGFGKSTADNLELVARLRELTSLGCPVLLGASRKRFLGAVTGVEQADARGPASLAVASLGVAAGARIVRVHDVAETVQAVRAAAAVADAGNAGS